MTNFFTGNRFLDTAEMSTNAWYIYAVLKDKGWTLNAICAMLGNMETESTINPGIWQNLTEAPSNGFGLVQWTPSTKFTSWCSERGLDPSHMDSALARIEYEVDNGLQWIATDAYPLSFSEFKVSTKSVSYLADAFLKNYERPADQDQPARAEQAEAWFTLLSGGEAPPIDPPEGNGKKPKSMGLLLLISATRRRF